MHRRARSLVFVAVTKLALIKSYHLTLSVPAKSLINSGLYLPFCGSTRISWLLGRLCWVPDAAGAAVGSPRAGLCDGRGKGMGDAVEGNCRVAALLPQQGDLSVLSLYAFSKTLSFK